MKSLTNFLTESKKDWVPVPVDLGADGTFINWSAQDRKTYEEIAKYGEILADAYTEKFGGNVGKSSRDTDKFYKNIGKMIPEDYSLDYFAETVAKCYVYAKLNGVDEKDIIPVTIGLTNLRYCHGAGYLVDPISCKWKQLQYSFGMYKGNIDSWCFYHGDFDDVKGWISNIVPYSKAVVE